MAGFDDPIEMDSDGVVLIGATDLDNVRSVRVTPNWERSKETRTVFQGKQSVYGDGLLTVTVTLELYDDDTATDNLAAFRIGHSTGQGQTITIRPLGTGNGLKEWVFNPATNGMDLVGGDWGATSAESKPYAEGTMVWEGEFTEMPAWTVQSA